jgi:DNA-directed RNA polymerase subunit alpha
MKTPDLEKLRKFVLDTKTATNFYGRFAAEPFERGYGYTIGNSLRRILLSSIEGAAITSVKITGALHEFAVLKGVKEDVAQIILNLKSIRVKLNSPGCEKLYLKVKKVGKVVAKDIEANANVEIMNPEQEIANIDNGTTLEMELEVSSGKGYVLAEELETSSRSVGTIFLDSLFSPITKVNYEVENTRVERILDYDRLIMEIWTDGSVSPEDALIRSAKILRNSLVIFTGDALESEEDVKLSAETADKIKEKERVDKKDKEVYDQPIDILNLSTRASNGLKNAEIETIGDLIEVGEEGLDKVGSFGKRSISEIKEKLASLGLNFNK